MMSISPGMGAGQAGGYFSREDYYLKGAEQGLNSRWCGEGARTLGLTGQVGEEEFKALCRGEDPAGNRIVAPRLTRDGDNGLSVETRRAGNDCTFSAPKSVSLAYAAGVAGIKEAHDAAVGSVLRHMEQRYSLYHSPGGLENGGMVAAKFDHATSRNIDPQLHSHVFVVNAVLRPDGSFRANEPKAIYQDVKSLGLLYRHELARELKERGFGVEITDRSRLFFELKEVDTRIIEHFSTRRAEIERQVDLWKQEGRFDGVAHGKLYAMAALGTRDPKREVTREEVTATFERGFTACGTSVEEFRRELELARAAFPGGEARLPEDTPVRMVQLAAEDLAKWEALFERAALLDQAVLISGGRHGLGEISEAVDGGAGVLKLGRDRRGREFYTTPEMPALEAGNLERVRKLAASPFPGVTTGSEIEAFRERLALAGIHPTSGQWREFRNEVAGGAGATLTVGDPGTAKTSTLRLVERFNEEVLNPRGEGIFSVNIACTGKAARELGLATGRPAFTVEGFLNAYAASKFELQREKSEAPIGEYSGEGELIPKGVPVILRVDEASFLGARQARELLEVVEELKDKGVAVKLHFLGDTKQMQAVQAGDFLRQLRKLGEQGELSYAHLTEILRQRDPELKEIASGLNREDRPTGENTRQALFALERRGELKEVEDLAELRKAAVDCYLAESRAPSPHPELAAAGGRQSVLMVAATNAERKALNAEVRAARVKAGEIEAGKTFPVLVPVRQGVTVEEYREGDTLRFSGVRGRDGRMHSFGARLGTEGGITGVDRERNLVRVSYTFQTRKRQRIVAREFPAAELAGKSELYREEGRLFSVGDRIVALKNDAKLNLQNGSLGTIKELDERGRVLVDLGDREVRIDLARYRQLDHAYAVTIHKSQGATVDCSIMVAPVRPETAHTREPGTEPFRAMEQYGRTSFNALNVAVTRARYRAHVFTNSIEGLARSAEHVDQKSSTLDGIPGGEPCHGRGREKGIEAMDRLRGVGEEIDKLDGMVGGKEKGVHRLDLDGIRLPELSSSARELHKAVSEVRAPQKETGRQLELSLHKSRGFGLEK